MDGDGVWIRGLQTFLDVRVFGPNTCQYSNSSLSQCYATNKKEKSITITNTLYKSNKELLALWYFQFTMVGVAFYSRLSGLLVEKRDIHKSVMMHWIRSKLCYRLLKSFLLCLRGSRLRNRNFTEVKQDIAA